MVQTTFNYATINIDAFILASMTNMKEAFNLAMKLGWLEKEEHCLNLHREGQLQTRLVELESEDQLFLQAQSSCKKALLDLNKAYHDATGRYIVIGFINSRENLEDILDEIRELCM